MTRRRSGSSGAIRSSRVCGPFAAGLSLSFAVLLLAGPAAADVSPAGCANNNSNLGLNKDVIGVVRPGQVINYSATVANNNAGGCDVTNATTTLTVPGADGTASGPTTTLATAQSYPAGTPQAQVGGLVPYTVVVNAGVSQITASDTLTGRLHDVPDINGQPTTDSLNRFNTLSLIVTQPHTTLTKTASLASGKVPLSETYTYTETNDGTNAPIGSVTLTDSNCSPVTYVSGDANANGQLDVGETWTYTCSNTLNTAGTIVNTATANGTDLTDGKPAPAETATASVNVAPATPSLSTAAASAPPATAGAHPTMSDTATLTGGFNATGTITFTVFGPNDATCSSPAIFTSTTTVAGNGTYTSSSFTAPAPGTYRFEAAYTGDTANSGFAGVCNASGESVTFDTPAIAVTKAATPPSRPAPGGQFTFTVTVKNPSATDAVKITSLTDDKYGNLATLAGSTCGALIGTTVAPGATSAPCSFTGPFTGVAGASQTDTVTVTGIDVNGFVPPPATAQAVVTLTPGTAPAPPQIAVTKVADPLTLPAPGGTFKFTVAVSNPSATLPLTITGLTDNIYGNLATRAGSTCGALIGVVLAPGATSAACSFTGPFTGASGASQTDVVTSTGANNGTTVTATAHAMVSLTPGPVTKPASVVSSSTLHRPAGCVKTSTITIGVTGSNIKSVSYSLDSRHLATVTKRGPSGLSVSINTGKLSLGPHKLVAVVTYRGGKTRTLHATIARCSPPLVPLFTG